MRISFASFNFCVDNYPLLMIFCGQYTFKSYFKLFPTRIDRNSSFVRYPFCRMQLLLLLFILASLYSAVDSLWCIHVYVSLLWFKLVRVRLSDSYDLEKNFSRVLYYCMFIATRPKINLPTLHLCKTLENRLE